MKTKESMHTKHTRVVHAYKDTHTHTHAFWARIWWCCRTNEPTVHSHTIKSSLFSRWFNTIFVYNFIIIVLSLFLLRAAAVAFVVILCVLFSFCRFRFFDHVSTRTTKQKTQAEWWSWMSNKKNNLLTAGSVFVWSYFIYMTFINAWNEMRTMSAQIWLSYMALSLALMQAFR